MDGDYCVTETGGDNAIQCRNILLLVQCKNASGFEGIKKVRVDQLSTIPGLKNIIQSKLEIHQAICDLEILRSIPAKDADGLSTGQEAFVPLEDLKELSNKHCRIQISVSSDTEGDGQLATKMPPENRLLQWRMITANLEDGSFCVSGFPLLIGGVENSGEGTGHTVWDGAIVLAKFLEGQLQGSQSLAGKKILELGAGTGLAGIASALLGASVVHVTDLEYCRDIVEANINRNRKVLDATGGSHRVRFFELDWASPDAFLEAQRSSQHAGQLVEEPRRPFDYDVVLAADVVWLDELVPLLVQALQAVVGPSKDRNKILFVEDSQEKAVLTPPLLQEERSSELERANAPGFAGSAGAGIREQVETKIKKVGEGVACSSIGGYQQVTVYMSYQCRSYQTEHYLFGLLAQAGFACNKLQQQESGMFYSPKVDIYRIVSLQ
mmetsp:Transcript_47773/g.82171  ORF Transcript_47773/g.82171 Transcript_47773/m.82171 type:complete len:438 (+) Transcript_47773:54-1367(+)